jgi:hypothetical protein
MASKGEVEGKLDIILFNYRHFGCWRKFCRSSNLSRVNIQAIPAECTAVCRGFVFNMFKEGAVNIIFMLHTSVTSTNLIALRSSVWLYNSRHHALKWLVTVVR